MGRRRKSMQRALLFVVGSTALCCLLTCLLMGTTKSQGIKEQPPSSSPLLIGLLAEPIQPIPTENHLDAPTIALGKRLFHDRQLSHDNTIACVSCHSMEKGGTDQRDHSIGINKAIGGINAPSVFNSGQNFKQFWNGCAATLEDQVEGPTQHPKEMGSNWPEILDKIKKDSRYVAEFAAIYSDGIQRANIKNAIATFERSLTTPNSPFDKYLRGDVTAISSEAKHGYLLFKDYGCSSCHQGMNIGGNMFAKFGVMGDYFAHRTNVTEADYGRYNVTRRERDRYVFRVPSLRNIALTAPYLHDGTLPTLEDIVQLMGVYQLGRAIDLQDAQAIKEFLKTLTGVLNDNAQGAVQ